MKNKDDICIGFEQQSETGDELLFWDGYGKGESDEEIINMSHILFIYGKSSAMHFLAKVISQR